MILSAFTRPQLNANVARNNSIFLILKGATTLKSRSPLCYGKILPVMEGVKTIITLLGDLAKFC